MKRQSGYYWVKMSDSDGFEVARYSTGGTWTIFDGAFKHHGDVDFLEINETPITPPAEAEPPNKDKPDIIGKYLQKYRPIRSGEHAIEVGRLVLEEMRADGFDAHFIENGFRIVLPYESNPGLLNTETTKL